MEQQRRSEGADVLEVDDAGGKPVNPPTLIFSGYSRLPAGMGQADDLLTLELEVDPYDMRIVDATCAQLTGVSERFLLGLLIGSAMETGVQRAMCEVRKRYSSTTQRAMIAVLEDVIRRYGEHKKKEADRA